MQSAAQCSQQGQNQHDGCDDGTNRRRLNAARLEQSHDDESQCGRRSKSVRANSFTIRVRPDEHAGSQRAVDNIVETSGWYVLADKRSPLLGHVAQCDGGEEVRLQSGGVQGDDPRLAYANQMDLARIISPLLVIGDKIGRRQCILHSHAEQGFAQ